jgi:type IV pilus modification protein PilV
VLTHRNPILVARRQHGFALIESLIAFLVVAFGLLAIASFQYTLSRASDVAKQRTEATRIAQKEMDRLRAFGQRQSDGNLTDARYTYVDNVVSTSAPVSVAGLTTNTTYLLERQVRDASNTLITAATSPTLVNSADRSRSINVIVSWTDRAGQSQDVRLASSVSDGDPGDLGSLGVRRRLASTLRPKNRNINVPYPAVNVAACPAGTSGNCSAFVAPPGNVAYVFSNDSGNVVQACTLTTYAIATLSRPTGGSNAVTGTTATAHPFSANTWINVSGVAPAGYNGNFKLVTGAGTGFSYTVADGSLAAATLTSASVIRRALFEGIDINSGLSGVSCSSASAYLISGFVRFVGVNNPSADALINPSSISETLDLLSSGPLTITTSTGSAPSTPPTCYAQRQMVVKATINNQVIRTISAYNRVSNLVTLTLGSHNFTPGMVVAVTGTANYLLQGRFEIASIGSTTISYVEVGPNATDTTGRVELVQQLTLAVGDPVPSAYSNGPNPDVVSAFVAYTCVVAPSTTGNPREWWGRLNLVPETSSANGRLPWNTSTYTVCRYSADYNGNGLTNSDHPLYYRQVTSSLDSQNFAVIRGTCPTDTQPTYTGNQAGDFYNTNSVAHQPTGVASPGEPSSDATVIPMQ